MGLKDITNTFIGMIGLDTQSYKKASEGGFGTAAANYLILSVFYGIIAMIIGGIAGGILQALGVPFASLGFVFGILLIPVAWVGYVIGMFIITAFFAIAAKMLGGTGTYMPLYAGLSYVALLGIPAFILGLIPLLGVLVGLAAFVWSIVMQVLMIREVHSFSTGRAVGAFFLAFLLVIVLGVLLALLGALLT